MIEDADKLRSMLINLQDQILNIDYAAVANGTAPPPHFLELSPAAAWTGKEVEWYEGRAKVYQNHILPWSKKMLASAAEWERQANEEALRVLQERRRKEAEQRQMSQVSSTPAAEPKDSPFVAFGTDAWPAPLLLGFCPSCGLPWHANVACRQRAACRRQVRGVLFRLVDRVEREAERQAKREAEVKRKERDAAARRACADMAQRQSPQAKAQAKADAAARAL
eukprot:3676868-Prymnesium_polylepis.1